MQFNGFGFKWPNLWGNNPAPQTPAPAPIRPGPEDAADAPGTSAPRLGQTAQERGVRERLLSAAEVKVSNLGSAVGEAKRHFGQYPELAWLADAGVAATNEGLVSPTDTVQESYSKRLGQKQFFPELERSLQSLRCLSLIVDGTVPSYQEFVRHQFAPKLSSAHFQELSSQWKKLVASHPELTEEELLQAAQAALVLGDMGKSPKARAEMEALGIDDPDHDDFYGHVMQTPDALMKLPSFVALNPAQQQVVRSNAGLAHFGHITHAEGGPAMYAQLTHTEAGVACARPFDFAMMVQMCDVAGALGHKNNQGSLTYNEHTHMAMQDTIASCQVLSSGDALQAYHHYLSARAERLGLLPQDPHTQMLARLGAMLRLFTPQDGAALVLGFSQLTPGDQDKAIAFLMPEAAAQMPRTPTYMPAVLVNLQNNKILGESPQERLVEAVRVGVPCIILALHAYRKMLSSGEMAPDVPLNFNPLAHVAATRPYALGAYPLQIDPVSGAVTLKGG
jgi:hypothetical protein